MPLPFKLGSSGPEVTEWQKWAVRYAPAYAFLLGPIDGYYGNSDAAFTKEMQRRLGLVQDGIFGDRTAALVGYKGAKPVAARRPIWFYSCPGSGADFWLGPSHDLGQMVCGSGFNGPGRESLNINHQPVKFSKGGYLGLMGGDPKLSYIDVITDQRKSIEWLLDNNPDVQRALTIRKAGDTTAPVDVELWLSGYSQSADGLLEAVLALFGDGGKFAIIRDRINGLILFGNPATPVTGIARKTFPDWLNALTVNINTRNDFYAVAKDKVRPLFYEWFIEAETELPFVVYSAQIILPAIANLIPVLGPLAGPFFPLLLAGQVGLTALLPLLTSVVGGVNGAAKKPNPKLVELLSVQGILTSLPDLLGLLAALPGLQSHGAYHLPVAEFGGKTGPQVGYDLIANFRR
ncbi:MAG TPA: peptidoglycan-binding domain-containing protein [Rhodoglobus sp.]|nr:peptidoglycan-binding domain-containing protein [Rhodoglobus sp.]